jgi:hypothetical protein
MFFSFLFNLSMAPSLYQALCSKAEVRLHSAVPRLKIKAEVLDGPRSTTTVLVEA